MFPSDEFTVSLWVRGQLTRSDLVEQLRKAKKDLEENGVWVIDVGGIRIAVVEEAGSDEMMTVNVEFK